MNNMIQNLLKQVLGVSLGVVFGVLILGLFTEAAGSLAPMNYVLVSSTTATCGLLSLYGQGGGSLALLSVED